MAILPLMSTTQVQKGIVRTISSDKNINGSPISGVIVKSNGNINEAIRISAVLIITIQMARYLVTDII